MDRDGFDSPAPGEVPGLAAPQEGAEGPQRPLDERVAAGPRTTEDLARAERRGRGLYEERRKLLPGLWMNDAPDWSQLSEEDKERWRRTAGD